MVEYDEELDDMVKMCIESGLSVEDIIECLEDYLADIDEVWEDEDIEYEVDEDGFYSLV